MPLIDIAAVETLLRRERLDAWAERIESQLRQGLEVRPHGDWQRWRGALAALPTLGPGRLHIRDGALSLSPDRPLDPCVRTALREALMQLHPWRKGPFRIGDLVIDTEWRSDWKWDRVAPSLEPLDGRLVLDVGCGNAYHGWRIALAGARQVIGIDPTALFLAQFLAIRRLAADMQPAVGQRIELLPVGIEALPKGLARFDTVFSMGVLYHRRSPIDHLLELRGALRPGGQLVLETLVIDGDADRVFVPEGRYAKMRNVWFVPAVPLLQSWVRRAGFSAVRTVDVSVTRHDEQRATEWMTFESLADFLDPADSGLTIEGHPAPMRAVLVAKA